MGKLRRMSVLPATPTLRRIVSRWQIVALSLNDVIGSGVYLLPAAAAAVLGPASLWAVLLAGLAVLMLVLCFAEAASRFDEPGGAYLYARSAFGALVGFEVGWMTWLARIASVASLSVGFAQALSYVWPAVEGGPERTIAIAVPLLGLTALNVIGVRSGVGTAVFLVTAKLVPLVVFVGAGAIAVLGSQRIPQASGDGRLGQAALLLLFAYAGFENTPAAAGEYRNPRRDVPIALLLNIGSVTALYFAVQWIALRTLPDLGQSPTPLADAAERFLGGWAGLLLTAGAAMSILGTNSNTVFAGPRYLFAMARDGFGPRWLAKVHRRFRTPAAAVMLQTAIALPLALSGNFVALAELSIVARLTTYLGTAAAVLMLRHQHGPAPFTIPGGPAIPIVAGILTLGLAASATRENLVAAAIALAVGGVLYVLRRRERGESESP